MIYVIQGNYGSGWEDVDASEDYKEAQQSLKSYDDNETYPHRLVKRKE